MKVSREEVLDEAARQLNRRGARASVLKDVADALGVTRMAIYWYVEDRQDLVGQCYLRTCEVLETCLTAARAEHSAEAGFERFLDLVLAGPELCAIVEPGLLPQGRRQLVADRFEAVAAGLVALLITGAREGSMRACDADTAARSIISVLFWVANAEMWNSLPAGLSREAAAACAKDFLSWGWAAKRREPEYEPISLAPLAAPVVDAFDRDSIAAARREQILAAASQLFNLKGVDSTRLDEVAAELGATTGAIYHHVGGKPALLAACHLRALELATTLQREANGLQGPRTTAMAAFQHGWARIQMQLAPLFPLTGFESLPRTGQEAFRDQVGVLTGLTLQMVEDGRAEGGLRPLDLYALRLQGGLLGWLAQAGIDDPARQDAIAREAAAQLLLGVRALP